MNTEHYKAASERTDADGRALTPAFKRTPATPHGVPYTPEVAEYLNQDKQPTFSGNPEWPKTPTKPQHSPLPWYAHSGSPYVMRSEPGTVERVAECGKTGRPKETQAANAALIVRSVNQADKLAEQLSLIVRTVNDTLRHGLTAGQIEALEDCVKSSNVSLEDYRK